MGTNMPGLPGDEDQPNDQDECQEDIKALQAWATQVGQKIGVPFAPDSDDQQDPLSDSIAATKPFGAGAGISNS